MFKGLDVDGHLNKSKKEGLRLLLAFDHGLCVKFRLEVR